MLPFMQKVKKTMAGLLIMNNNKSLFDPAFFNPTLKQLVELKIMAEQGNTDTQFHLGICFIYGKGCSLNIETGFEWIKLAADNGHKDAIAFINNKNSGRIKTLAKYFCYIEALIDSIIMSIITGEIIREYFGLFGVTFLFFLYFVVVFKLLVRVDEKGNNENDKNIERARTQTYTLIKINEPEDFYNLGLIYKNTYLKGSLNPYSHDKEEALKWFELAADKGHDLAKSELSTQEIFCHKNDQQEKKSDTPFLDELGEDDFIAQFIIAVCKAGLKFVFYCLCIQILTILLNVPVVWYSPLFYLICGLCVLHIIKFLVLWVR